MNKITFLIGLIVLTASSFLAAHAQSGADFNLSWNITSTGSGACGGGGFALNGTVGQPEAASAIGGSFSLHGGFWPGMDSQEIGPALRIAQDGWYVKLSWATNAAGFSLYKSVSLANRVWTVVTDPA